MSRWARASEIIHHRQPRRAAGCQGGLEITCTLSLKVWRDATLQQQRGFPTRKSPTESRKYVAACTIKNTSARVYTRYNRCAASTSYAIPGEKASLHHTTAGTSIQSAPIRIREIRSTDTETALQDAHLLSSEIESHSRRACRDNADTACTNTIFPVLTILLS